MIINFINMPMNLGCNRLGVEKGGSAIRSYGLNNIFSEDRVVDSDDILCRSISELAASDSRMKNIDEILKSDTILADKVHNVLKNDEFPLVFGGDHSLTWGSLSGISKYFGTDIGCIYLDAHGDFNSAESSPTGNVHGMHMYYLMGFGNKRYVDFYYPGQKINPKNVFFLGTRSLDNGEVITAEKNSLNIHTTEEIHNIGVEKIFKQLSIEIAHLKHIHFSLDIDCIDPIYAPGTGVPEPYGLTVDEVEYLVAKILSTGKIVSMDFVEFNPLLDFSNQTFNACIRLMKCIDNNIK